MSSHLIYMILAFIPMCMTQPAQPVTQVRNVDTPSEADVALQADTTADHESIALIAIDRQCGSCHHGDRSTNTGALEIFNLKDTCWHCKLTPEQCESLKGRISGSSFSEEERTAIVAVIAHLSEDDETSD